MKPLSIAVFIMLFLTNCHDKQPTLSVIEKMSILDTISFEGLKGYTLVHGYSHWDVCGSPCDRPRAQFWPCDTFKATDDNNFAIVSNRVRVDSSFNESDISKLLQITINLDVGRIFVDSCENVHVNLKGERSWRHSLVKTAQIENDTMLIDCQGDVFYKYRDRWYRKPKLWEVLELKGEIMPYSKFDSITELKRIAKNEFLDLHCY